MTTTYAASPVVNREFDAVRRMMFGDKLLTDKRFAEVEAFYTHGMTRAAIESLRADPYYGIRSKGRTGAKRNLADQMAARPARPARNPGQPLARAFKEDLRQSAYLRALRDGKSRNEALKAGRRVAGKERAPREASAKLKRAVRQYRKGTPTGRYVG